VEYSQSSDLSKVSIAPTNEPNIPSDGASACAQIVERVAVYRRADVQYRDLRASAVAGSSDFDWLRFDRRASVFPNFSLMGESDGFASIENTRRR
jgi:hypothetical protein